MILTKYRVICDGTTIDTIEIPDDLTQMERDDIRSHLAKEYHIPTHYLRLIRSSVQPIKRNAA